MLSDYTKHRDEMYKEIDEYIAKCGKEAVVNSLEMMAPETFNKLKPHTGKSNINNIFDEFKKILDKISKDIYKREKEKATVGNKDNPYLLYVSSSVYKYIKPFLDTNNMYCSDVYGWIKVCVDKTVNDPTVVIDSYDTFNHNNDNTYDTSYDVGNEQYLSIFNQPNRENRRKEMKKKTSNPHELNVGRINPMYTKDKDFCQKERKKQFNDFIKGKVK